MAMNRRQILGLAGTGIATALAGGAIGAWIGSAPPRLIASGVSRARHVRTESGIPASADVVVIGGGIAGICTALSLREQGMDVVLCEKGYVAGEQSSRAYGWIVSNGWHPEKVQMADRGMALWNGMAQRVGADVGHRRTGNLTLLSSDEDIAFARNWITEARARSPQNDTRLVTSAELDRLLPHGRGRYLAALYQPSGGMVEPTYSPSLVAEAAQRAGVRIVAPCAVRGIETSGGALSHIITEMGAIRTRHAVLAGGVWSSLFCGNAGISLPQLGTINSSLQRVSVKEGPSGSGIGADYSWRRQADGDYTLLAPYFNALVTGDSVRMAWDFVPALRQSTLPFHIKLTSDFFGSFHIPRHWRSDERSPFERARLLTADYDDDRLDALLPRIATDFPAFRHARVKERWGGVIDVTPDSTPVISSVPGVPGLMLCTGFSGAGLTMAPAAAEMIAQMMGGRKTTLDPTIFRFERFTDGSATIVRD